MLTNDDEWHLHIVEKKDRITARILLSLLIWNELPCEACTITHAVHSPLTNSDTISNQLLYQVIRDMPMPSRFYSACGIEIFLTNPGDNGPKRQTAFYWPTCSIGVLVLNDIGAFSICSLLHRTKYNERLSWSSLSFESPWPEMSVGGCQSVVVDLELWPTVADSLSSRESFGKR